MAWEQSSGENTLAIGAVCMTDTGRNVWRGEHLPGLSAQNSLLIKYGNFVDTVE